jgi:hypothetical protein
MWIDLTLALLALLPFLSRKPHLAGNSARIRG